MFKKITKLFKGNKEDKEVNPVKSELEQEIELEEDIEELKEELKVDELREEVRKEIKEEKKELKKQKEELIEEHDRESKEEQKEKAMERKAKSTIDDAKESIKDVKAQINDVDQKLSDADVVEKARDLNSKLSKVANQVGEKTEQANEKIDKVLIPVEVYKEEVDFDSYKEDVIQEKEGFFKRLKTGLSKTRQNISEKIDLVLSPYRKIDEELFEDLEEVLIMADIGVETTVKIIEAVKQKVKLKKITDVSAIKGLLKEEMKEVLLVAGDTKLNIEPSPAIVLVVGVNGAGKTTTIGKLSARLKDEGKKVLIVAGDTFRAAAIEQLEEWANRSQVDIISHQEGSDAAAVIFDGIQAAKARKTDVLICDTAGRLHNKKNLMNELSKIFRIVEREYPEAKKEVLLVVDATTGQNAIIQAKTFKEACDITGIVLTKLDGTAKGGVVIGLQSEMQVPVKLVGVGEKLDDLQDFNADDFVNAIFEE